MKHVVVIKKTIKQVRVVMIKEKYKVKGNSKSNNKLKVKIKYDVINDNKGNNNKDYVT